MNAEERVLKTLNHEEPDKVPYFESTFTNDAIMKHFGLKPSNLGPLLKLLRLVPFKNKIARWAMSSKRLMKLGLLGLSKFYLAAGIDIVPSISALFPMKIRKDGFVSEFGHIYQVQYYKDGTEILGYIGGYFKSFDDYESHEKPDPHWNARLNGFLAGREIQAKLNNQIFSMPTTVGLMEVTWEGFGIETFSRIMGKRKQAKKVFNDRGEFTLETVKILAENDAKVILVYDDYGFKNGLFMSPKKYREYVFPWLKRACSAAHKHDCKILLHSDGDLSQIVDDLVKDVKIDALNPIEPTTANPDYDIFKLKEKYGDKLTLVGNVSPMMLATGEIEEIKGYTTKLMKKVAPGGGYILASGHSINPAVTVDRWLAMMDVRDTLGIYPIK